MIRESRFFSWTIEGTREDIHTLDLAKEIHKYVVRSCETLDIFLRLRLEIEVQKSNFYVNNTFCSLFSIYDFFKQKILDTLKEYEQSQRSANHPISISMVLDKDWQLKTLLSNYSFALMSAFYSFMDFLMLAVYSFERPKLKLDEFRGKRFNEKFKILFPVNTDCEIKQLYDELNHFKKNYRNPLTHGLLESEYLVHLPSVGLIPLSYQHISKKISHRLVPVENEDVSKIIDTFTRFLNWVERKEPYSFYMIYIHHRFPIPMREDLISEIKKEMISLENFNEFCDHKAEYLDRLNNRDF